MSWYHWAVLITAVDVWIIAALYRLGRCDVEYRKGYQVDHREGQR
jgi:Mn2+/Fe2+ NRAMP family transporter